MFEIKDVNKSYNGINVLKNVNMSIEEGSIYALIGSNGAGKSTILNLLADVYAPDSGEITYQEEPLKDNAEVKEKLFYMPEVFYLQPLQKVSGLKAYYKGIYCNFSETIYQCLVKKLEIDENQRVHRLSKGNKCKVAFVLALSCQPECLILDEPFDGLDPIARSIIKKTLIEEVAERRMTIIISTHILSEVENFCDHIGLIHKGRLILEKPLDDLRINYQKIQFAFADGAPKEILQHENIIQYKTTGNLVTMIMKGEEDEVKGILENESPVFIEFLPLSLEEIFELEMEGVGYGYK